MPTQIYVLLMWLQSWVGFVLRQILGRQRFWQYQQRSERWDIAAAALHVLRSCLHLPSGMPCQLRFADVSCVDCASPNTSSLAGFCLEALSQAQALRKCWPLVQHLIHEVSLGVSAMPNEHIQVHEQLKGLIWHQPVQHSNSCWTCPSSSWSYKLQNVQQGSPTPTPAPMWACSADIQYIRQQDGRASAVAYSSFQHCRNVLLRGSHGMAPMQLRQFADAAPGPGDMPG